MGANLIILAAIGLGALYVLHLLAQDYNKIRRPVAAAAINAARSFLFTKRDLNAVLNYEKQQLEIDKKYEDIEEFVVDWENILQKDPLNCILSLVCQITAGAENGNPEAVKINELLHYSLRKSPPKSIQQFYNIGKQNLNHPNKCYWHAPFCPYSAKTMFKILKFYTTVFI